ncbi:MAG: tetratricopeptide repeat protein [Candidatus Aminicenantes bacterium]|nr:tetratricopeptide repeat protein [Candidatus Aminicenantes bacterium]
MRGRLKFIFYIMLGIFFFCYLASGQAGRGKGRLNGTVLDDEGKPISGAKVIIQFTREKGIQWETTTNKKGEWAFLGLGSGLWLITASAEGYLPAFKEVNVSQIEANPKVTLSLKRITPISGSEVDKESIKLLDQASALFNERKYDDAIAVLNEFLAKNPEFYPALINLAECYREKGEYGRAIDYYQQAIEESKKNERWTKEVTAKALSGIGECFLRQGNLDQAQKYFKQAVDFSPDNEMVAYNVGEIYFSNQKLEEAIQYFSLAVKIKPDWSLPYYKLGLVYLNKNEYELAKENFKKFLSLEPESDQAATVKNILEYLEKIKK